MVVTVTELKNKAEAPPASGGREPSASRDPISTEEDEKKTSRGAPTASAAAPAKVQKKGKKKDEGKKGKVETLRREVLTTQSPGLTRKQKVYESKLWPKHYKPKVMKTRMAYINENAPNKNKNTAAQNKNKKGAGTTKSTEPETAAKDKLTKTKESSAGFKIVDEQETYVVTSFTDWMPCQLKTARTLCLEQYAPVYAKKRDEEDEDDIPEHLYNEDDTIRLYANMAPPG